ncbi:PREDICTED: methylated-DNA--protein-cysteine methyltransferase [Elephantulus edwardii]|uniref:methylated-DNA--protein-cysteine methyltransferase n=1 Tax=Elephantulus edwardii TaxID=28737 RepID=UPI0003F0CBA1|nr:PREDICTED: methylated-DNA--protein-cysteine methyltransferase [Elephantulus edwardii]
MLGTNPHGTKSCVAPARVARERPSAVLESPGETPEPLAQCAAWLMAYFQDPVTVKTLPVPALHHPVFQQDSFTRRVLWKLLAAVDIGEVVSYQQLAILAGNPRAARAVGGAMRSNPVPILIPCHRVISSRGTFGGYSGGLTVKQWLLSHEGAQLGTSQVEAQVPPKPDVGHWETLHTKMVHTPIIHVHTAHTDSIQGHPIPQAARAGDLKLWVCPPHPGLGRPPGHSDRGTSCDNQQNELMVNKNKTPLKEKPTVNSPLLWLRTAVRSLARMWTDYRTQLQGAVL